MIIRDEALSIAAEHLKDKSKSAGFELVLLEDKTLEREFGWVFFYDSKEHIASGGRSMIVAGNAPFIVDKKDGMIHTTGTAYPLERYLVRYQRSGSCYQD